MTPEIGRSRSVSLGDEVVDSRAAPVVVTPAAGRPPRRSAVSALGSLDPPDEGRHPRRVPRRASRPPRTERRRAPRRRWPPRRASGPASPASRARRRGETDAPGSSPSAGGPSSIAPRPQPFEAAHLAARPRRVRRRRPSGAAAHPTGPPPRRTGATTRTADTYAMSFSFLSGRTFTEVLAGLAFTSIVSPGRNGFGTFSSWPR